MVLEAQSQRAYEWISSYSEETEDSELEEEEDGSFPSDVPPPIPPKQQQQAYPSAPSLPGKDEIRHNGGATLIGRELNANNCSVVEDSTAAAAAGGRAAEQQQKNDTEERLSEESVKSAALKSSSYDRPAAADAQQVRYHR